MIKVKIKGDKGVEIPTYQSPLASGFDLKVTSFKKLFKGDREVLLTKKLQPSLEKGFITLRGFERVLVGTGIYVEMPQGYEIQIRPRSGKALKQGLTVVNTPGTIDADYRGEIGIILINNTPFLNRINLGDRVAQGVAMKVQHIIWEPTGEFTSTERGSDGFGSTGE